MSDLFRREYKELTALQKDSICIIKIKAEELWKEIEASALDATSDPRMIALAKTNLEQAIMWAIKGLT